MSKNGANRPGALNAPAQIPVWLRLRSSVSTSLPHCGEGKFEQNGGNARRTAPALTRPPRRRRSLLR
jgi:hypothetical protein